MGLPLQAICLLAREHSRVPFAEPVLVLGRQDTYASREDISRMLLQEHLVPSPLNDADLTSMQVPGFAGVSDQVLFALMGLREVYSLDISAYQRAEIVQDLNTPLDPALVGRFGTVLDSGTMEHVFDVRCCLRNIVQLLRPGGRIVHMTPANNYVNHGFIQASPTLFYDFYEANGFTNTDAMIILQPRENVLTQPWNAIQYDPNVADFYWLSTADDSRMIVYFSAVKGPQSTGDVIPTQRMFRKPAQEHRPATVEAFLLKYSSNGMDVVHVPWQ